MDQAKPPRCDTAARLKLLVAFLALAVVFIAASRPSQTTQAATKAQTAAPGAIPPGDDDTEVITIQRGANLIQTRVLKQVPDPEGGRPSRPGSVIVTFRQGITPSSQSQAHQRVGAMRVDDLGGARIKRVKVDPARVEETLQRYRAMPEVLAAEPDLIVRTSFTPNDPCFTSCSATVLSPPFPQTTVRQWGLASINAPTGWDTSKSSSGVRIAILDTGIFSPSSQWGDQNGFPNGHPDVGPKVVDEVNFTVSPNVDDNYGHGTMSAGTAAAITNNATGIAGVGFNASIVNVKVIPDNGLGSDADLISGIHYAAGCDVSPCIPRRAEIASMSLGAPGPCSTAMQTAVDLAWAQGVVLVAAAGNSNVSGADNPGNCNHVIAVAAADENNAKASFSNFGADVDVAAPGQDLPAPDFTGGYSVFGGTSASTPYVSGLAALLWTTTYNTSNQAVDDRIFNTANVNFLAGSAHGLIDAAAAVSGGAPPTPTASPTATLTPTNTPVTANCPCSIWAPSATPGVASIANASPWELGVKFRADQAGYITGLRFYKGPTNTGTHVAHLWSSTGTHPAGVGDL